MNTIIGLENKPETNKQYHDDLSHVGHSMLETFRESPVTYAARYVHQTMQPPEPTAAMMLGTALHAIILEPDRFDDIVVVAPRVDRRTKDGRAEWGVFESESNGRAIITQDQNRIVTLMAKSVLKHPEAKKLIERAECRERSFRWTNEQTGINCKCKPDLLWQLGSVIGDLKTTSDPSPGPWSRQAASLAYSRQTAWYRTGIEANFGREFNFLHVVVGTQEPYETAAYFIEPEFVMHAQFQNQQALNNLKIAFETGDWTADQNKKFKTLSLPRWVLNE